jgi:hypothetical protein
MEKEILMELELSKIMGGSNVETVSEMENYNVADPLKNNIKCGKGKTWADCKKVCAPVVAELAYTNSALSFNSDIAVFAE